MYILGTLIGASVVVDLTHLVNVHFIVTSKLVDLVAAAPVKNENLIHGKIHF